jgi:hypothetical protein
VTFLAFTSSAQTQTEPQEPVPNWLQWRVFHESLVFYDKQAPRQVRELLAKEFRLTTSVQAAALLSNGQVFIADIHRIDDEAKAEARKRYRDITEPLIVTKPPTATKLRPIGPRRTILQRAREDGFSATVDGKKQAALANHLRAMATAIGQAQLDLMNNWVQTKVAPKISVQNDVQSRNIRRGLPPTVPTGRR